MRAFSGGGFGSAQRLSASGLVVFGLLTFWVYSVLRFASALRAHFERRWREVETRDDFRGSDVSRMAALRARGFTLRHVAPSIAAILYCVDAALVAWWFAKWIVWGDSWDYAAIMIAVGASSLIFFAATLLTMAWALMAVRNHEMTELLVREAGAGALSMPNPELGEEMVQRWERITGKVTLFLVFALPISFSPTLAVHLLISGTESSIELAAPVICFALAGVFHVWGTILLVGLYNGHLETESKYAAPEVSQSGAHGMQGGNVMPASADTGNPPERELVAIMLTDMFGYSKAMERNEAHAYAMLVEHNRILRGAIVAHRGREIKTIGDAFLVTFRSAIDAVDCALAAQRTLADYNLGKSDDDRILVRIGIHLGDVIFAGNDVYGDGVNVASRIEALAEPGGICVSEPVFEMVRKKVQLDVQKVEGAQLKNIAIPPNLYRIRLGS